MNMFTVHTGDALTTLASLPDESVHCCVTSPPYFGLRDYGNDGQIGLETTPEAFISRLVGVFREVRRVLKNDGTLWVNMGDSYSANQSNNGGYSAKSTLAGFTNPDTKGRRAQEATNARRINHGCKPKDLIGVPWMLAFALRADGYYLRSDIIWSKPNPMPESVTDRCTKAHEYIFLLSKSEKYYYDADAIKEEAKTGCYDTSFIPSSAKDAQSSGIKTSATGASASGRTGKFIETRNKRSVWEVATKPYREAHFATYPPALITPCIRAGCPVGGVVLDPFTGSGTTGMVALEEGRQFVGIELNPEYAEMARRRIGGSKLSLFDEVNP